MSSSLASAGALLLLWGLTGPALAQEEDASPVDEIPTARPNDLLDPKAKTTEEEPRERASSGKPDEEVVEPPVWKLLVQDEEDYAACLDDLKGYGVSYRELPPVTDEEVADCGIVRPLEIDSIVPGVSVEPKAVLRCPAVRALAEWVTRFALPASLALPDRGPLISLQQGSTYVCRRRNNADDGLVSEHAFGNAIDIMAFGFASGDPIPVEPRMREGTMAEAFQRAVRASACLSFTTVLGPGTDSAHADHLHLDIKERRGDFRLCQ
ncbi:MAG: extensin family protein [Rhodovibrionaceae bacterium]